MRIHTMQDALGADDEVRLASRIEAGIYAQWLLDSFGTHPGATDDELNQIAAQGRQAWNNLYLALLPIVARLAKEWAKRAQLPFDELFQEGSVRLGECIRLWDHRRGCRLSTFVWSQVEPVMTHCAATRCGQLDCSLSVAKAGMLVAKTWQRLESREQRDVSRREVAEELGWTRQRLDKSLLFRERPEFADIAVVEYDDDTEETRQVLLAGLAALSPLERQVIESRCGISGPIMSQRQLSRILSLSPSTVGRVERRALGKLRRRISAALAA